MGSAGLRLVRSMVAGPGRDANSTVLDLRLAVPGVPVGGQLVFSGSAGDPKTFHEAVKALREKFGLEQMIMAGDRGMITRPGSGTCAS